MRVAAACADCGIEVSRPTAKRCGACAATERMRHREWAAYCADCGAGLSRGTVARCNRCEAKRRVALKRAGLWEISHSLVVCPLDGGPIDGHPRCASCTALCGTAHTQVMTVGGVCDACVRHFGRAALSRVQWGAA